MGRIKLLIACLVLSFAAQAQTPPGFTKISSRYNYLALSSDSGLLVPRYAGVPSGLRGGMPNWAGQFVQDTTTGYFYGRFAGTWEKMAKFSDIGTTYTFPQSVIAPGDAIQLVNDSTVKPANYFYGTNVAGRLGYYPQSGIVGATPLSSLTAAVANNTISNGLNRQTWKWDADFSQTPMTFSSNAATTTSNRPLVMISLAGTGIGVPTIAAEFLNQKSGAGSINYGSYHLSLNSKIGWGLYSQATADSIGYGGEFTADGSGINYGIKVTASGGTENYAVDYIASGGTEATAARYSATGATENNAIEVVAGNIKVASLPSGAATDSVLTWDAADSIVKKRPQSTVATAVPINGLTAATGSNNIDNGNNNQLWNWTGLGANTGLLLSSNSTAANSNNNILFKSVTAGANSNSTQTTYAGLFQNSHSGTSSTNVALALSATSATNNYALIVASGDGSVGIGTSTPAALLHVLRTTEQMRIGYDASNYWKTTVASNGATEFDAVGGGGFTIKDSVNFNGQPIENYSAKYNVQTGTSYTLLAADNGKIISCNNGSDITLTVPAGLPAGFTCTIIQLGAGEVIPTASSTTLNNRSSFTKTAGQYAVISITMYTTDTFVWGGDGQ